MYLVAVYISVMQSDITKRFDYDDQYDDFKRVVNVIPNDRHCMTLTIVKFCISHYKNELDCYH